MTLVLPTLNTENTQENKNPSATTEKANLLGESTEVKITGLGEKPAQAKSVIREINVQDIKDANVSEFVKFSFLTEAAAANEFVAAPTNPAIQNPTTTSQQQAGAPPPIPFINAPLGTNPSVGGYMGSPIKSKEDVRASIKIVLAVADMIMSNAFNLLAGDNHVSTWTVTCPQKVFLEDAVVEYVYDKKVYVSPGTSSSWQS